jgi:hypothetical protein
MRATILISTLAACAASPAMAQCVQVVCPPPVQVETHYQQPVYDEYVEVEEAAPRVAIHKPRPKARHHVAQKRKAVHHVQRKAAVRRPIPHQCVRATWCIMCSVHPMLTPFATVPRLTRPQAMGNRPLWRR